MAKFLSPAVLFSRCPLLPRADATNVRPAIDYRAREREQPPATASGKGWTCCARGRCLVNHFVYNTRPGARQRASWRAHPSPPCACICICIGVYVCVCVCVGRQQQRASTVCRRRSRHASALRDQDQDRLHCTLNTMSLGLPVCPIPWLHVSVCISHICVNG
jgi:hypothetical protein